MRRGKARRLRDVIEQASGSLPDVDALDAVELFPAWKPNTDYTKGQRVREDGLLYRLIPETNHSQSEWPPHLVPAVWARVDDPGEEWPEWQQPLSAEDAYSAGAKVSHQGKHWVNSHGDGNVWEPGVYGWQEQPESIGGGEESEASVRSVEWHQCPEAVREYLANTDYTGVSYTESVIENYAPSPPSPATNTKPIGKTVDGATFYNNVPNVATPFATANAAGTLTPLDQVRWIKSQTANMRDLGGWACDGGKVRYGLIFRSGNLAAVDFDLLFSDLGIRWEIDLTADGEAAFPGKIRHVCHPSYAMYSLADTEAWRTNLRAVMDAATHWEPCVIHCSMGADRTGTLACVLEALLGVSQSNLDKDYELTSFYALRARSGNYQGGTADWAHLIGQLMALDGETIRDKAVTFVLSLGFTAAEINAYRRAMIDGTPADITGPTFTVTNSLSNCASSNSAVSIGINESYAATITAASGYTLDGASVSVSMGDTDITASAYSNGNISVPSVTGALVITIAAAKEETLKELFDPSAATINQRFNSSGAYSAQNGNFCSDYIPVSGIGTTEPWRIHIKDTMDATRFRASAQQESILFCKADKTVVNLNYGRFTVTTSTSGATTACKHSDPSGGVYIDINKTGDGNYLTPSQIDLTQVAYIRVCMTYSSGTAIPDTAALENVSITADEISN